MVPRRWTASTWLLLVVATSVACTRDVDPFGDSLGGGGTQASETGSGGAAGTTEAGSSNATSGTAGLGTTTSADSSSSSGGGPIFDVGGVATDGVVVEPVCTVVDGMDPAPCTESSPPDSFDPVVQWSWGDPGVTGAVVIPLVANFTDDDGNGEIDLCDTPDVLITTMQNELVLLDGATGTEHWTSATPVHNFTTPAIGDIDGDGFVEIVTRHANNNNLVVLDHNGAVQWMAPNGGSLPLVGAFALADLDADGDVEILYGGAAYDHLGALLWTKPLTNSWSAPIAVDLDDDGDMEVLVGGAAYHHDGSVYFADPGIVTSFTGIYSQIANLDDDPEPEILISAENGVTVLEHDGTTKFSAWGGGSGDANRPLAIHDFDGDGLPEFGASALGGGFAFGVYEVTPAVLWSGGAVDSSGQSGGTAFDFLGAGVAQAIYADETTLYAYDDIGQVLMSVPRSSLTHIEYPVVVDVDNDGSAEILMISSVGTNGAPQSAPAIQVIRDVRDRWVPARRIWNQHTYHVTNVFEDGTIPQQEAKSWQQLNTYRTQAQVMSGGVCAPPPAG